VLLVYRFLLSLWCALCQLYDPENFFYSFLKLDGINFVFVYLVLNSMIRRLSALFFLSGMLALLLFQQPAFAYCAHTNQFFISDCGCEKEVESKCPLCQKEQPSDPCNDCSEKIQLDVDDLVWFDLTVEAPTMVCFPIFDGAAESVDFHSATEFTVSSIRPPPRNVSLFLFYSVFRL
jgi:hypothetical protein